LTSNTKFRGFKTLFYALVVVLLTIPALESFTYISVVIGIVLIGVLLVAVRAVASLRRQVVLSSALAVVSVIGYFGNLLGFDPRFEALGLLGFGLFFLTVGIIILTNIMLHINNVTAEMIYGAINVYLLVGLAFAFMLALVEFIQPGSIIGLESLSMDDQGIMPFVYFSFVTMTTLGYGDLSPVTGPAATIVYIEAIFGQLFIAIMIARLVGLYVAHGSKKA
jgi:voltage-gated potassium channel